MRRKPNIAGGGSKTTENGLSFEGRTDLLESFQSGSPIRIPRSVKLTHPLVHAGIMLGITETFAVIIL